MTETFYFPLLFLCPDAPWTETHHAPPFQLARRFWGTSIFDLAALASHPPHKLHLPYQVVDVMLGHCNIELAVEGSDLEDATAWLSSFLLGLYSLGCSPTIAPFATNHSINVYSGINDRGVPSLKAKLPKGMQLGPSIGEIAVEAWPIQLSFSCVTLPQNISVTPAMFLEASKMAKEWRTLEARFPTLQVVRDSARVAPMLVSRDQSLLHVWCALESLFPKVATEVSFKVALYLAQLQSSTPRVEFHKLAKKGYDIRSKVAHGSLRNITFEQWRQAWDILLTSVRAILERRDLPSEDALLQEILQKADEVRDL